MKQRPKHDPALLPCPFCGGPATIQSWHGGGPKKRLVTCEDTDENRCFVIPSVTGGNRDVAIRRWNWRAGQ